MRNLLAAPQPPVRDDRFREIAEGIRSMIVTLEGFLFPALGGLRIPGDR
jgi:hypothetical protein